MTIHSWKKRTALFLGGQAVTLFGSSLVQFAMIWFVALKTSSGFWVSMLTVCAYLPQFLVSFFAGVWADRYSRKLLIIISDASIAVATLALALALPYVKSDTVMLTAILVVSAMRSVGAGIQTPAVGALLPQLVPQEQLMRVNGINSTIQSIVQFAAPAAAGALLSISTLNSTLFIDVATAAVGIGILVCLAVPKQPNQQQEKPSVFADLVSGIRYAIGDGFLWKLFALFGAFIFLCVPAGFLASLFVSRTYGNEYWYLTVVELVGFAGMTAGGIIVGAWGGFKNRMKTLLVGMAVFGALAIGMGAVNNFYIYLGLMLLYGIALTFVQTATTTLIQERSDPQMLGRMFGFFGAIFSGFLPIGMVVFGPLADIVSMQLLMILSGVLLLLITFICLITKLSQSVDTKMSEE